jgi:hypothetical protein
VSDEVRRVQPLDPSVEEAWEREVWFVTGDPSGQALAQAAAAVVDEFADRTRVHLDSRRG